jgi:hypothetical protein
VLVQGDKVATKKEEEKEAAPTTEFEKTMAGLQKFVGPIFEQANKIGWGGTKVESTTTQDPFKTAAMIADIPTLGDKLLGAVHGFITGAQVGEEVSVKAKEGSFFDEAAPMVGAALGTFLGSKSFSTSRKAGYESLKGMNSISEAASMFGNSMRESIASDAVATYSQRMGELNNPRNVMDTMKKAAEKDKAVSDLTSELFRSGIAPDKAVDAAQKISAIYDPQGRFSSLETQALYSLMKYNSIPADKRTPEDARRFLAEFDALQGAQLVKLGKLPPGAMNSARDLANETLNSNAPSSGVAPSPRAPGRAAQPPAAPPSRGGGRAAPVKPINPRDEAIDELMMGPGQPSSPMPKASSPKSSASKTRIDPKLIAPVNIPPGVDKGLSAKLQGINNARGLSAELAQLLESGAVKSGPENGRSFEVYLEGVGGKFGASASGVGGNVELPPIGAGELDPGDFNDGNWFASLMGGGNWVDGEPEEIVAGMSEAYSLAQDIARAGVAAKQGLSINQITQGEIAAELKQLWNPKFSNEQNLRNLERYLKNLAVNLDRTAIRVEPSKSRRPAGFIPYTPKF